MRRLLAGALLAALAVPASSRAQEIDTLALRGHTFFLAHDLLEGRGTGTRGERMAAAYIASQLARIGVPGAGPQGSYFQPVPLRRAVIDRAATRLVLHGSAGDSTVFEAGRDFVLDRVGQGAVHGFAGTTLFAGTAGLAAAALAGRTTLDGQVIVILGTLGPEAVSLLPEWKASGAAGVVLLEPEAERFNLFLGARGEERLFVEVPVDDPIWQPDLPLLVAGAGLAAALLAGAPLEPDALDGKRPFAALALERSLAFSPTFTFSDVAAANVAALIPGRDPARRHEVVAFTAHYDHLGVGAPDERGDSIYNGFSDNAAGVAMLLEIARVLARRPPARSVLFLFFTGEELGLLGSSYYAAAPLLPLERMAAVINLDAGAPPAPPRSWRVAGGRDSSLGELAATVAAARGLVAQPSAASPNSDYWPFLRRAVPAIFLIPGGEWEGLSGAEKEALHQRWDHYHRPGDEWAPDFPLRGLQRYAQLALAIGRAAANRSERRERRSTKGRGWVRASWGVNAAARQQLRPGS